MVGTPQGNTSRKIFGGLMSRQREFKEYPTNWSTEFNKKNDYMAEYCTEVTPQEFYADMFEADTIEGRDDKHGSTPIISVLKYREDGTSYVINRTMFNDYEALKEAHLNDFSLCSCCSFYGKKKTAKNAYKLHAFCIDLDGVDEKRLRTLFLGFEKKIIPYPTYIVNSGHGVHVYYMFEQPIPLYPKVIKPLQRLKKGLTREVWTRETSTYKVQDRQFQGIYQNFRMVGSKSKLAYDKKNKKYRNTKKFILRAFKVGDKVDLSYLNHFVDEEYRFNLTNDFSSYSSPEITPLSKAQELWPEWYEKRIIQQLPKGHYVCSRGLYDWWLAKIPNIAKDGNRYWCIAFLYVYGVKCNLAQEWIDEDAFNLIPMLDDLTVDEDNSFTDEDVMSASRMYKAESIDCPVKFIEEKCGIHIERAKRNGRTKEEHLKIARFIRDMKNPDWQNKNGRPKGTTKEELIKNWRAEHPQGTKADCNRDTKIDPKTIRKWWA